ncbi:MAG: adenylosuccinate lyase, partial [Metallosphaera sp.]
NELLSNLRINLDAMERNLRLSKGLNMAESLMINLTLKGLPRHKAHELVSRISREARKGNSSLLEEALKDKTISSIFSQEELERILNPKAYLGQYKALIQRAIDYYENLVRELNETRGVIH